VSILATKDTRDNTRLLLHLVKPDGTAGVAWPTAPGWDWRTFAAACEHHHLAPFVYCRLQELKDIPTPAGLVEWLRARFFEVCAVNYQLANRLAGLTSELDNAGIRVLSFKGPALAMSIYGDLSRRQYSDLDVVVRREHLRQAVDLMCARGFRITPVFCRPQMVPLRCRPGNPRYLNAAPEIAFHAPDKTYFVDLHWQLGHGFWRTFSPDVETMWERTVSVALPQGSVSTFSREDLFLALSFHGTTHRWSRLKWLLDIAQMLRASEPLDWSRIGEMIAIKPEARLPASLAVFLARELLGVAVPAESERILRATRASLAAAVAIRDELLVTGQTSGDEHTALLELEKRRLVRMRYHATRALVGHPTGFFAEVFVQITAKDRAVIDLPPRLAFLYHVVRPVRLAAKHATQLVRSLWSIGRQAKRIA
jgi:hypothetical protein